jgi:hypothetical protein
MAVDEPWARIVRHEPDREVIRRVGAHGRNVADDGVIIVVSRGSSAADHMEVVSVQVDGVLQINANRAIVRPHTSSSKIVPKLTGPP